jgi:beta-mannosidase
MDLRSAWRAHPADEDLRRHFHEDDLDDRSWEPVAVPGHWRDVAAFAHHDGPFLYRCAFTAPAPAADRRQWLWLDGVFAQGDVWLDGAYLGDTEGYFVPHAFEVTELGRGRAEHLLAIEVTSSPPGDLQAKRSLTGAFQHGDHLPRGTNPGGLWRPVRLVTTGPVAVRHARLRCTEASEERGMLALRLVADSDAARSVTIRTRVCGVEHERRQSLAAGENRVEWTVAVPRPVRWWPHALGPAVVHDVVVDVVLDDSGEVSDGRRWRTGFRTVDLRRWVMRVNGERLFLKGAVIGPARADLGNASVTELETEVRRARDAGLDLLRVHTHLSRPELYEAADRLGMLVWQDLPLHRRYARGVRKQATRQAREAVDALAHHPSVALWCAHNEPYLVDEQLPPAAAAQGYGRTALGRVLPQQLPTWNRTVLDASVKNALERNDGTRPVIAHSGVAPHLPQLDGTDNHLWFGWYEGEADDLAELAARLPRAVRFVSELGAQAVPADAAFCHPERWPDLAWESLVQDHGAQMAVFDQRVSPDDHADFASWQHATQRLQADLVRRSVEILRRLKYRPTGGFCVYRLADAYPAISFGLIGHDGTPKPAYDALVAACRPVLAITDPLPEALEAGTVLSATVHVVSDRRHDLDDAVVHIRATWATGRRDWTFTGPLPADSCVRVGEVQLPVPPSPGPFSLVLTVRGHGLDVANRYDSVIR